MAEKVGTMTVLRGEIEGPFYAHAPSDGPYMLMHKVYGPTFCYLPRGVDEKVEDFLETLNNDFNNDGFLWSAFLRNFGVDL